MSETDELGIVNRPGRFVDDEDGTPLFIVGEAVTHTRITPTFPLDGSRLGPDVCKECSDKWQEWVKWPCEGRSIDNFMGTPIPDELCSVCLVRQGRDGDDFAPCYECASEPADSARP